MLYKSTKEYILNKIKYGEYKQGESIPPERDLGKKLDVSRHTVRKAIQELVEEDYLYRVQGNGTFVKKREINKVDSDFIGVVFPTLKTQRDVRILDGIQKRINSK